MVHALRQIVFKDAERWRYIARLEFSHTCEDPQLRGLQYCFMASDGKPFWGDTYGEAVDKAMAYDKEKLFFK